MRPTDELCKRLDELGVKYDTYDLPNGEHGVSWIDGNNIEWEAVQQGENFEIHALQLVTPEQAVNATVGMEKWEPSKERKAWHNSLRHDNPTSIREAVENILYEAIDFGGDMGPNGNVWSGVDEGTVLTGNCIDGWVESIARLDELDNGGDRL